MNKYSSSDLVSNVTAIPQSLYSLTNISLFTNNSLASPTIPALPPPSPLENWDNFNVKEKTDYVMGNLFVQVKSAAAEQVKAVREELAKNQHYFFTELDKDISDKWMFVWPALTGKEREITKLGLINLAIKAYLDLHSQAGYAAIFSYAISLYEDETPLTAISFLEKLRLYKLQENLKWFNLDQNDGWKYNPLQFLQAILAHNNHLPLALPQLIIKNFFEKNPRSFDEAALLWNQLHRGEMFREILKRDDGSAAIKNLRTSYVNVLIPSWRKQQIIDQLFQRTPNFDQTAIYYDGFVFKNAQNLTFDELINRPELTAIKGYTNLALEEKRAYLQEAFNQLGESTQYKIGSLSYSLASCLIRIFHYQHNYTPTQFSDEQQLIHLFMQTEKEWEEKRNYPIHPRVLAALHLVCSNNISIEGKGWRQQVSFLLDYLAKKLAYVLDNEHVALLKPRFDPRQEKAFNERLFNNAWIKEKAKMSLKSQGIAITPEHLAQEVSGIAKEYTSATEDHQRWAKVVRNGIYLVPVIGSLKMLREGLEERSWKTVLVGEIFLTLDAWGLTELSPLAKEAYLSTSRLTVRELLTIRSLRSVLEKLDLSPKELIKNSPIVCYNPFPAQEEYGALVQKLSQGDVADKLWRDNQGKEHFLVYIRNEDRVVPVRNQGGYYREVNWRTGELDLQKPLIYKDKEIGYYITSALKGSGFGDHDFFIEPIPEVELTKRPTIKEALQALAGADDYGNHSDFLAKFHKYFKLGEQAKIARFTIENKRLVLMKYENNVFNIEKLCQHLYVNSPTFRRLFNKFVASAEPEEDTWRVEVKTGQDYCTDLENKIIYLNPDIESSEARYLSTNYISETDYEGEIFHIEKLVTHEFVHALTNIDDLQSINKQMQWLMKQANRGGTVYLTDRILFEAFKSAPARLVYRAFVKGQSVINQEALLSRLVQENHFLDSKLDTGIPIEAYKTVAGEEWAERYTIQEVEKLTSFLSTNTLNREDSSNCFLLYFYIPDCYLFDELACFYDNIFSKSRTFKQLFNYYADNIGKVTKFIEVKRGGIGTQVFSSEEGVTHFVEDDTLYLSSIGPIPIQRRRRFLEKILELFTGLKREEVPIEKQFTERGAIVQLADQIFREAKMEQYFPKRLAAANILPDEEETLKRALNLWPELSRLADWEDKMLEKEVYSKRTTCNLFRCIGGSRTKRGAENAENKDDIKSTMREISDKNQPILQELDLTEREKSVKNYLTSPLQGRLGFFRRVFLISAAGSQLANVTVENRH